MTTRFDPFAPLVTIGAVTIRQRITGALYVRWPEGEEQVYPVGFSMDDVEVDVRRRLADSTEQR